MGLGLGFVAAVLVLKMGLGFDFVAAGATKELVVVVLWRLGFGDGLWVWPWVCGLWPWVMGGLGLQWVSGLMLGLDCGSFSGGSFDFVVFLVEGLILSAVVQFTVCGWDVGICFAA
jgi:hypothetical protein